MNEPQKSIGIALGTKAHEFAKKIAAAQTSKEKSKLAYLNSLAVYAVHDYLKWLQIDGNLESIDSWHSATNCFLDVQDIGKLVCCPVLPGETRITPPELLQDAVVYVIVKFKEVLDEVEILAFRPILDNSNIPETISLNIQNPRKIDYGPDLFPIENLLSWLFYVQDIKQTLEEEESSLVEGIRRKLEEQMVSSSQFAAKSLHLSTKRETFLNKKGKELLSSEETNNPAIATLKTRNSSQYIEEVQNEDERELEQMGGDWLRLVKQLTSE
jgi:hypothetical protein